MLPSSEYLLKLLKGIQEFTLWWPKITVCLKIIIWSSNLFSHYIDFFGQQGLFEIIQCMETYSNDGMYKMKCNNKYNW